MKRELNIRVADPAGNITIFVLDRVPRSEYASVARQLLDMDELGAEQVAFVTGPDSMDMCGMEFCGNASRAFALMCSEHDAGLDHERSAPDEEGVGAGGEGCAAEGRLISVPVNVSGASGMLTAMINRETGYAEIDMPLCKSVSDFNAEGVSGKFIDLGGISHLVLRNVSSDDELFIRLRDKAVEEFGPPAFGVMFCHGESESISNDSERYDETRACAEMQITPIVFVRDVDSVYHEGSCASGATAVAIAESMGRPDGEYRYIAKMPAGTLDVTVTVSDGTIAKVSIGSAITLKKPQIVTVDMP